MKSNRIDFDIAIHDLIEDERDEESHSVDDPYTFHPSQMVVCRRQMFNRHLGINHVGKKLKGIFHTGTLLHEWLEEGLDYIGQQGIYESHLEREHSIEYELGEVIPSLGQGIRVTGTADVIDFKNKVVYDYKTQKSIYPKDYHKDQLQLYMHSLALADPEITPRGGLVYINKCDLTVEERPEDGLLEYDPDRVVEIKEKAEDVRDEIIALMERYDRSYNALIDALDEEDIPFEKCGCFFCGKEELAL